MNLAILRVRETHGIRRFLYPLTVSLSLPDGTDLEELSLTLPDGTPVPLQVTHQDDVPRLDFAVFLAPYEQLELSLSTSGPQTTVNDPLRVHLPIEKVFLISKQERFTVAVRHDALLRDVTYDDVLATRDWTTVTRNGRTAQTSTHTHSPTERPALSAWATAHGIYPDGVQAITHCELTACKSWATVTHTVHQPIAGDVITFTLPLTVTALPLLCDFGIGGGVYGKIGTGDTVTWETQFAEEGSVQWTLATNGRTDYAGTVATRDEYHAQQWFHVLDKGKALAVALTRVPDCCRTLTVTLNSEGDVQIAFTLGDRGNEHAEFGVCYHFLNDAPAIAAATNPQSILLPPTVQVLPA